MTDTSKRDIIGIINPPPEIRFDTAASFVASNGKLFEAKLKETEKGNPKFSFLYQSDVYYQYYIHKIQQIIKMKEEIAKDPSVPEEFLREDMDAEKYLSSVKEKPKEENDILVEPPKPSDLQFLYDLPAVTSQDFDVIKLTAQFMARNGRLFINALSSRESRNSQFDFLRTNHALFPLFTKLVECYTALLIPSNEMFDKLNKMSNKYSGLDEILLRVEHSLYVDEIRKRNMEKEDKERSNPIYKSIFIEAYLSVDWHDFVVVQTIEFNDSDDPTEFNQPLTLSMLVNYSESQKKMAGYISGPQLQTKPVIQATPPPVEEPEVLDIVDDIEEPQQEPATNKIKIKAGYKPKIKSKITQLQTQTCQICGRNIAINEIEEHMRVELLDPKWKIQKEIMEAKQQDSNIISAGIDIAKNLKDLSSYRSDIFGTDEDGINKKFDMEKERKKREDKDRVIWDGSVQSINIMNKKAQEIASKSTQAPPQDSKQQPSPYTTLAHKMNLNDNASIVAAPQPPSMYNMMMPAKSNNELYTRKTIVFDENGRQAPIFESLDSSISTSTIKRPKIELHPNFVDPQYWLDTKPDKSPITINIVCPEYSLKPEWGLKGQTLQLENLPLDTTIEKLKSMVFEKIGFPALKQKLSVRPKILTGNSGLVVAKNNLGFDYYNIDNLETLYLAVKERGGRK